MDENHPLNTRQILEGEEIKQMSDNSRSRHTDRSATSSKRNYQYPGQMLKEKPLVGHGGIQMATNPATIQDSAGTVSPNALTGQ